MTLSITKPQDAEGVRVITRYELLQQDIEAEKKAASTVKFNYDTPFGNKEARSYVYKLRRLKTAVDKARKDEKADALEYGRRVDAQAKEMIQAITTLIEPHQQILDEIEQKEADRKARHQAVLDNVTDTRTLPEDGWTSTLIQTRLDFLQPLLADMQSEEPSVDYEEFNSLIFAEIQISLDFLAPILDKVLKEEADAAELERLRAEEAARLEAERIEAAAAALAAEAIAAEKKRIEEEAAAEKKAAEKRQAKVLAEQKAQAEAAIEAERKRSADALAAQQAEAAAALKAQEAEAAEKQKAKDAELAAFRKKLESTPVTTSRPAIKNASVTTDSKRIKSINELVHAMAGMNRMAIATAIVDGKLHDRLQFYPDDAA